ncbi:unnamed protein product [Adineta steineri]|uniref:Protein kinase domain-containing protein n=1 Tax=Adineta steineri TaxID=433720 RepID=A0A819U8L9_9BILA|nr:unnamed protein product [Adineta steineri]CAF4076167.1 unnamed protein product [Adineta steineri]
MSDSEAINAVTPITTTSTPRTKTTESTHTSYSSSSSAGVQSDASSHGKPSKQDNFEVFTKTSYLYYSMKLCEGDSLEQRLIPYKLTKEHACNVVDQIAKGIAYIHEQKLIHGDIKPANIFFSAENLIKIGDFGLVAEMSENSQMAITSRQDHGTKLYMAPELQKNGQGIHYDEKVDIYAMGIVFLEVLAPFKTDSERYEVLGKIQDSTKKSSDLTPILASYEKAVDFHLSVNGEERYQLLWQREDYVKYGFIAQIIWSTYLDVFLVLSQRALFSMKYLNSQLSMKRYGAVYALNKQIESRLRFITCGSTDDHLFLNRGYHTVQQYKMSDWTKHREWTKISLNYKNIDEIRDITIDRNGEYLVMNVQQNRTTWFIDIRAIDDNLTQWKHIAGFHHKLQMYSPSNHWLFVHPNPNKLFLYDVQGDDVLIPKELSFGDNEEDPQFSFSKLAPIYFRWMGQRHLLLGTVVDSDQTGALKIYKI